MEEVSAAPISAGGTTTSSSCAVVEAARMNPPPMPKRTHSKKNKNYMTLLVINYAFLFVGSISSTLLSKFYFVHGGSSRWISTLVQSAGFPILLPPIFLPLYFPTKRPRRAPFHNFTPKLFFRSTLIGLMLGINNLLISWGNSYLPVSTSALLLSSQLAFTLILSVLIVKQRINFSNLNCVVLLTLSSLLVAFGSGHDHPPGLTRARYFIGFASTVGAGLLFALYLPVMERVYREVDCYSMVMEMQVVMEAAATAVPIIGMAASGGFREPAREAGLGFDLGPGPYWGLLAGTAATWQLCFMGTAGMVFLTTSITGGICMTALVAMNVVGGVVAFKDEFGGVKVVATLLCLWGFCSYVYGKYAEQQQGGGAGAGIVGDDDMGEMEMIPSTTGTDRDSGA